MTRAEPIWIDEADALALHERLLAFHGGPEGLRDASLLQSALARPRQIAAYDDEADIVDLAAAYTFGVVKNHPFVDGNKRTAFVIGVLFLELNGFAFIASEEAAAEAVLALAAGTMNQAAYAAFLRDNATPG